MMMGSFLHAQIVNIPDINFKNALIEAGVDDIKNLGFKLYPNPVKDIMILESDVKIINPAIKIFSLEGRLLSTQNLEFEKQTSLDVSRLSNGIYLLQITSEGKQITYKFMKE